MTRDPFDRCETYADTRVPAKDEKDTQGSACHRVSAPRKRRGISGDREQNHDSRLTGAVAPRATSDTYFSLKSLSIYAGLSVRRLRSYLTDRNWPLPFYRIGGKILVRRSDFDMWAAHFRRDAAGVDALVDDILQGLE